jgi:low temperature requirement protein LtrA
MLWIPAIALDLAAPVVRYWLPGRGRAATTDWDIVGEHFAERCQLFIIIALGESIVLTGATATEAGLTPIVTACLVIAFVQTVALWWLYFGTPVARSHHAMSESTDPGRIARDAYTYLHVLIVAGIIATAAADELLIAEPHEAAHGIGPAILLGGPALFLLGESLFQWRTVGVANPRRLVTAGLIIALAPVAAEISTFALALVVTALLGALAISESRRTETSFTSPSLTA